ncbi:MAG: hypothetical protein ABSD29_14360 [Verrucomicrobiota bacterium]|jgi:hypothetical protein
MRAIKLISLFAAAFSSLSLRAQLAGPAGPPANLATNRPPYVTQVKRVGGPGLIPANFAYVTFETNKFGFVMPAGFRLETQDTHQVTLVSADFNCLLTFRVLEPLPPGVTELDPAPYRDLVLSRRRGGKILEEFSQAAVSRRGPAFDLRWNAAGSVPRRERVLFVPSNAGVLEFALVSSLEKFETGRQAFNALLLTFRAAEADGRLVMPVMSDRL